MLKKIKSNKYIPYFIILFASLLFSFNFFRLNLADFNEARIHIIRITAIKELLLNNIFPCLISPNHMMGFGYALNIFYGPITTYIPILFSFIFNSNIMGLKFYTLLTIILSGVTMYNFVNKISNKKLLAIISALIYISAPYKITNIYSRNAVGEYTSFIFIPLVFQGLYEILNSNRKKNILIIIGAVGLILSHTITTIYVSVFALSYLLINYKKINKILIKDILIDLIIIIAITAFYWIPILEHKLSGNYTIFNGEIMNTTGRAVFSTGLGFKDFLASEFGNQEIVFSIGIVILFTLILTIFTFKKLKDNSEYTIFLVFGLISLWMCTKIFPWVLLPSFLTIVQFAWRLEGFFIFFISYVCACNIMAISEMLKDIKNVLPTTIIIVIILCGTGITLRYFSDGNLSEEKIYENMLITSDKISPYQVNREYLPLNADQALDYIQNRENKVLILDGNATIENEVKNDLNLSFTVSNVSNDTLELPYIYYHGYTIKLNDSKIKYTQSKNGMIEINLTENGTVTVKYTGTAFEKAGYVISGVTLILCITYLIVKRRKN